MASSASRSAASGAASLLGLLAALFGLAGLVLLTQGLLFGGALVGQLVELGVRRGGLGLELGEQGLLGVLLGGDAVVEAGLFQISHAVGRSSFGGWARAGCDEGGDRHGVRASAKPKPSRKSSVRAS